MQSIFSGKTYKDLLIIAAVALASSFLIWLPHILKLPNFLGLNFSQGFQTIYRNFDGLEYVFIAKTLYFPNVFATLPQSMPAEYFAAHFPGFSLLMLAVAPLFGFLKSMILIPLLFTILSAFSFYFLVRDFRLSDHPLLLSIIFLILPARWLIVHSVGSAEPIFIFFAISALYFFMKFEHTLKPSYIYATAIFGILAQFTRPPGILLFIALSAYIIWKTIKGRGVNLINRIAYSATSYWPLLLIPVSLLGIFYWYSVSYGDFFAYFHSGDNIHLTFPPFQVFNKDQAWVGDIWLEDIIYILILGFLGGIMLIKQKLYPLAFFVLTYLGASTLVAHRDVSRYILPIFPFVLIAFEKVLVSKEFRIVLIIVALAIYLYAQNFILANTAPYPNPQLFN
ncbi:hypothetical protein A3A14_00800 [Candidatus Daviesbacteria bacterium RIFCSPLOWO2_01_FULL_43_38]|uniref:Glycosyltransferase RgtA/B/C/D-like domain-containing protein n=2 Tax=Candidatus Daviesiibacteriota TaxID=1752718 RepID=A0A1F5K6M6_9BACT|nr:MAG: hypothetical protein UV41_C0002G0014 [Candidatus Daviesbacteria bacterium GW2011_GWA2_42_7]OGE36458.1 MAG: hypothetical protein A3E45_00880 [Candidatus Daviesbacteria bacterium RIFCSPHIGHO2_12_FULL_43_11]OGE63503.1 MAG: hypothetical protein A3A14_00800 [Candidatus Daviesbacteria bacterium RIFCSPLOWO2_01_FULL_43_38]